MIKQNKNVDVDNIIDKLNKNKFKATYVENSKKAVELIGSLIPKSASIGFGGSVTTTELKLPDYFVEKGNKVYAFSNYPEADLYQKAHNADWYISSVNALISTGEMVNIDGRCNRIGAIVSGPKNVILVAGVNKIVDSFDEAIIG